MTVDECWMYDRWIVGELPRYHPHTDLSIFDARYLLHIFCKKVRPPYMLDICVVLGRYEKKVELREN
jgi:hypothetical protein